jgi:dihydrofolate reductase
MIALVAALDEARLIGVSGRLPWHSPADMAHFRALTMGKVVVMGRKTREGLRGPLDGRLNVVVTSRRAGVGVTDTTAPTAGDAVRLFSHANTFVIGGASVYAQALPWADRLCLTRIRHTFPVGEGAVYFPEWSGFRLVESKHREADTQNPWPMDFETWERT